MLKFRLEWNYFILHNKLPLNYILKRFEIYKNFSNAPLTDKIHFTLECVHENRCLFFTVQIVLTFCVRKNRKNDVICSMRKVKEKNENFVIKTIRIEIILVSNYIWFIFIGVPIIL